MTTVQESTSTVRLEWTQPSNTGGVSVDSYTVSIDPPLPSGMASLTVNTNMTLITVSYNIGVLH